MEDNIREYLESLEKIKISIVMQVYLGDYPTARFDALGRFRRAIKSFENQIYKNCELIIVADGCNKTQQIYNREFKSNPNIRFVYLDRDRQEEPATYETIEYSEQHFNVWRGEARAFGVTAASGSVITYMDSDDYLTPQFTQNLLLMYNASKDKQWWLNKSWYENQASSFNVEDGYKTDMASQPTIKFDYLPSLWKEAIIEKSTDMPWLFAHKADCTSVKWRDTFGRVNEHADFVQRFIEKYNKGAVYEKATYVRCHCAEKWDI